MKVIWALFDSGNGCYKQAVEKYFKDDFEIYSIGIDIENKNDHFINVNLADYSELFGVNELFEKLDKLPKPDIILASPPCESWSNASAMKQGNACWYTEKMENMVGSMDCENPFTIRTKKQILEHNEITTFKKHWHKTFFSRVNGELCAFNTTRIIEKYNPKVWVIENPQSSKIWEYMSFVHGFKGVKNVGHYSAYNKEFSKKPTIFMSNIYLDLWTTREECEVVIAAQKGKPQIMGYNKRSNIPLELIKQILERCKHEV